jgi:phage tail protein X
MGYYTVKIGESFSDICLNSTGSLLNWDAILQANGINDWTPSLSVGQQIYIPDGVNTTLQLQSNVQRILSKYPACNNSKTSNMAIAPTPPSISFPIILSGATGDTIITIPKDTLIQRISFKKFSGATAIKIGSTDGGSDIVPLESFSDFLNIMNPAIKNGLNYTSTQLNIYISITGVCTVRIDAITNYF